MKKLPIPLLDVPRVDLSYLIKDSCAAFNWFLIFRLTTIQTVWPRLSTRQNPCFLYSPPYPPFSLIPAILLVTCIALDFFLYKKILGSSSFLVRSPTRFLQGHPFFLLLDVCALLV